MYTMTRTNTAASGWGARIVWPGYILWVRGVQFPGSFSSFRLIALD